MRRDGVRGQVVRRQEGSWQAAIRSRIGRWRGKVRCQVVRRQEGRWREGGGRSEGPGGQEAGREVAGRWREE
jgi:hypothetical protein